MKNAITTICAVILLCGCVNQPKPEASHSSRLTEATVLELADAFAKRKREEHEPFDLKFYPDRKARFEPKDDVWWILYNRKPNRYPGDHFGVRVDDNTEELSYFGGR
jgi:hypothetical protein